MHSQDLLSAALQLLSRLAASPAGAAGTPQVLPALLEVLAAECLHPGLLPASTAVAAAAAVHRLAVQLAAPAGGDQVDASAAAATPAAAEGQLQREVQQVSMARTTSMSHAACAEDRNGLAARRHSTGSGPTRPCLLRCGSQRTASGRRVTFDAASLEQSLHSFYEGAASSGSNGQAAALAAESVNCLRLQRSASSLRRRSSAAGELGVPLSPSGKEVWPQGRMAAAAAAAVAAVDASAEPPADQPAGGSQVHRVSGWPGAGALGCRMR